MLGIDDPFVWLAYVLCLASTALCVICGRVTRNRGDEPVEEGNLCWAFLSAFTAVLMGMVTRPPRDAHLAKCFPSPCR